MPRRPTLVPDDDAAEPLELGARPPSTHSLNGDIAAVAERLFTNYAESFAHLRSFHIAYLRRDSTRVDEEWDADRVAVSFIVSDRLRAISDFDAGIAVQGKQWDRLAPNQRQALVHRSLLKLALRPKGAGLKLVKPDVSEFAQIARIYGPWEDQLKLFAEQLDAHERGATVSGDIAAPTPPKKFAPADIAKLSGDQPPAQA